MNTIEKQHKSNDFKSQTYHFTGTTVNVISIILQMQQLFSIKSSRIKLADTEKKSNGF